MTAPVSPDMAMLNQLGIEDPKLQRIAQIMALGNVPQVSEDQDQDEVELERKRARRARRAAKVEQLSAEVSRLREANSILLEHCEYLALAVGACPECWGEDAECRLCKGDGGPGAFTPGREEFSDVVLPALERVRRRRPAPEVVASSATQGAKSLEGEDECSKTM